MHKASLEAKIFIILKKRVFNNFQKPIDLRTYQECVQKFVSMDLNHIKDLFFSILDSGKDGRICETDMFEAFKTMDTIAAQKLMQADLRIIVQHINEHREKSGKSFDIAE